MDKVITKDIINDSNWESLLRAIDSERVVPIIGGAFFYTDDNENLERYVLERLKKRYKCSRRKDADFTMLADVISYNCRIKRDSEKGTDTNIYQEIFKEINCIDSQRMKCKREIVDFLSIKKFPLILTTSCYPKLEDELRATYGNVSIFDYVKSARPDIGTDLSSQNPTLCYMFGKVKQAKKQFVVTEDDLLDYMHSWHNLDTRPNQLSNYLKDKFLLVLGCEYPNWLFKFFWHSLRSFDLSFPKPIEEDFDVQGVVASESINADEELTKFLRRIQTKYYKNSKNFIDEFLLRWEGHKKDEIVKPREVVKDSVDLFISYAHEDVEAARNITNRLKNLGAKVWFDERELEVGDPFAKVIEDEIRKAKRFVPLLSHASLHRDIGFYRYEWERAREFSRYRYGNRKPYFTPIVIDDSDVNDPLIPEEYRDVHIIKITDSSDSDLQRIIRDIREI